MEPPLDPERIVVATRDAEHAQHLLLLPRVEVTGLDVSDDVERWTRPSSALGTGHRRQPGWDSPRRTRRALRRGFRLCACGGAAAHRGMPAGAPGVRGCCT
ncbi:hypothetical protein ACU4GD_16195 [Cupriavidus basilensis]